MSLESAASVFWMLDRLYRQGFFTYDSWRDRFRAVDSPVQCRDDRRFQMHLKFLREQALPVVSRSPARPVSVKTLEGGRYALENAQNLRSFAALNDPGTRPGLVTDPQARVDVPATLADRIVRRPGAPASLPGHPWLTVFEALDRQVRIEGAGPDPGSEGRVLEPLLVVGDQDRWFLVAAVPGRLVLVPGWQLDQVELLTFSSCRQSRWGNPEALDALREAFAGSWPLESWPQVLDSLVQRFIAAT